jgi:succinate dehydrogenase / fumarate reductase membrane anchor subunit
MNDLRSPIARVRGLGSAKDGTHHWWLQRVTAVALVPLVVWFAISLTMIMLILVIAVGFWHAALGLQVVIEDYVHAKGWRIGLDMAVKFAAAALTLAGIVAIFRIAFGG